jgi:colanic acid/amylovoran biosynthesis glycosyltransferase
VTFHGWDITIERVPWKIKSPLYYQLLWNESALKRRAAKFIAVSKFIESKLIEKGYPPEKIIQHYIGINTNKFVPSDTPSSARYILCVGRHTEKKGIDTLLRAFARIAAKYPEVSLIQVGKGHLENKLKKLAETLGIANQVKFLGAQPYDEVQRLMRGAEIFALPSQTASNGDSEGLPFVILEAMASAIPVASTRHSGIPEAVLDGETGLLVEEKDDEGLADRLNWLLCDRAAAKAMGQRGREVVCECFDIQKQTAKLEGIYDQVVANAS